MATVFTLFFTSSPYSPETVLTAARIAKNAMIKGHRVNLIASGDGVYTFLKGQKAKVLASPAHLFSELIAQGLKVYLCRESMNVRCALREAYLEGIEIIPRKELFTTITKTGVLINL